MTVFILDDHISVQNRNCLAKQVREYGQEIVFCNVAERLGALAQKNVNTYGGYNSYAAYARIFVRELLPKEVDRVLYLDCDTIVEGDIGELYECRLDGKTLGAVRDTNHSSYQETIGLQKEDVYFNSGVLLIDLKRWEEKNYLEKILHHITTVRSQYQNVEQDILNIVAHNDIHTLHPKYNHIILIDILGWRHLCRLFDKTEERYYGRKVSKEAALCPTIIHYTYFFTGRPWFSNSMNGKADRLWDYYLQKTPWASFEKRKQKFSFAERCQRIILGHRVLPPLVKALIFRELILIRLKRSNLSGTVCSQCYGDWNGKNRDFLEE